MPCPVCSWWRDDSLRHGAASVNVQLCHSTCELGYLRRSAALLSALRGGPSNLSRQLSLIVLPRPCDDFDMLKNPVRWVQVVVSEARIGLRSRPDMFVCWQNVEIFSISSSSRGQLYVTVSSW